MSVEQSPLRKLRRARGLTLAFVARQVGIDTGNLSRIERGLQCPNRHIAARLAAFYAPEIDECHINYPERYPNWTPFAVAPPRTTSMEPA